MPGWSSFSCRLVRALMSGRDYEVRALMTTAICLARRVLAACRHIAVVEVGRFVGCQAGSSSRSRCAAGLALYERIDVLFDPEPHRAPKVDVREVRRPDAAQPVVLDPSVVALAAASKARDLVRRKHGLDDSTHQRGVVWQVHATRAGRLFPPKVSHRRRWQLQS